MRIFKSLVLTPLIAALIAAILLCGCSKQDKPSDLTDGSTGNTTEPISVEQDTTDKPEVKNFVVTPKVTLVRPYKNSGDEVISALMEILQAWSGMLGENPGASDDFYKGELVRKEIEVLIGETNRPESVDAAKELTYYDYTYNVISPECVIVCGGSDEATLNAARKFLSDCYGYVKDESKGELKELPVGTSYTYKHDYGIESLTLNGKNIADYTIVHTNSSLQKKAANLMKDNIEKISGISLDISLNTEFKGKDAIFVGCGGVDGTHVYKNYGNYSYLINASENGGVSSIIIDASTNFDKAVEGFAQKYLAAVPSKGTYNIEIPKEEFIGCNCIDETNGLVFISETKEIITDGLVYSKRIYKDSDGKPVVVYVTDADLSKLSVINATPGYGEETSGVRSTTKQAMQAAAEAGYQVFAGVNADFFAIDSDYHPKGLCIKQGKVLRNDGADAWFGITKDGTPVIGTQSDYNSKYKDNLAEAVGGRYIILKDGFIGDVAYGNQFGYTRHPRTAVGITADNHIILMVVDGRQPSLSNGASLGDLAMLMKDVGAVNAINLDGGGSSGMVTCSVPGKYIIRNSPSDGSLRKVYNSLVVVKKEN